MIPSSPRKRGKRILIVGMVVLVGGLFGAYVMRASILQRMGEYLVAPSEVTQADIGFVLGGGRSNRADFAAELFQAGQIHHILLSGAGGIADVDGVALLSEQEILERMLHALKIPEDAITKLPDHAKSTEDEIAALSRYLRDHPGVTCLVISSNYHTRRCQILVRHLLEADAARVRVAGAPSTSYAPAHWWKSEEGLSAGVLEWTKLVSTWLTHGF